MHLRSSLRFALATALLVGAGTCASADTAPKSLPMNPMAVWLGMMEQWSRGLGDSRSGNQRADLFAQLRSTLPCSGTSGSDGEDGEHCILNEEPPLRR